MHTYNRSLYTHAYKHTDSQLANTHTHTHAYKHTDSQLANTHTYMRT